MSKKARRNRTRRATDEVKSRQSHYEARLEFEQNKPKIGPLVARTPAQRRLLQQMRDKRLVFATGPAGSGKTWCPTSYAVEQLEDDVIDHVIITRPMVGCDEDIGALPGDMMEKYAAWVGPFMDVLHGKLGRSKVETLIKYRRIVVSPLMTMRGTTFRNAFVILDEAQNTTVSQMKMFLTRIGEGTRVVITGDPDQSDLPGRRNGLQDAMGRLDASASIGFVQFQVDDIVRDPLVREIVMAYSQPQPPVALTVV